MSMLPRSEDQAQHPRRDELLTLDEQHEALTHLHACLAYDADDYSSQPPDWEAIQSLLGDFTVTERWSRR